MDLMTVVGISIGFFIGAMISDVFWAPLMGRSILVVPLAKWLARLIQRPGGGKR